MITIVLIGVLGAGVFASREVWWPYAELYIPQIKPQEDPRVAILMDRMDMLENRVLSSNSSAPVDDVAFQELEQERKKLSSRLAAVIKRLETVEYSMQTVERMATAVNSEKDKGAARESLQSLVDRINMLEKADSLEAVATRVKALEEQTRIVDNTLSTKAQLLEDVKRRMDGIESRQAANANALSPAASALILAVGQLRDVVRQGQAFAVELDSVIALAPDNTVAGENVAALIKTLKTYAGTGVATHGELRHSFANISVSVLQADRRMEGDGWISEAINRLGNLVTVRRVDPSADADSTDARLARAEADLTIGDLAAAVEVLDGMTGPAVGTISPWLERAKASLAVEQALISLNSIAIAQLSAAHG